MALHVHRFGPVGDPPIIVLHGLMGHGRRWRALAAEQLPAYHVHAPDLRGHGRSEQGPPWTFEQYATDILSMMDDDGIEQAPVIGHSMGAVVGVYLARLAPQRVDRLVLLDPALELPSPLADQLAQDALRPAEFDDPRQAGLERARSWPAPAQRLVEDEIETHLVRGDDGRWRWRYSTPACVTAYSELARPAVTPPPGLPTLLVIGGRSRAVSPAYVDACRAALGDLLTVVTVDCGHLLYLEQPAETGRLIREFLA